MIILHEHTLGDFSGLAAFPQNSHPSFSFEKLWSKLLLKRFLFVVIVSSDSPSSLQAVKERSSRSFSPYPSRSRRSSGFGPTPPPSGKANSQLEIDQRRLHAKARSSQLEICERSCMAKIVHSPSRNWLEELHVKDRSLQARALHKHFAKNSAMKCQSGPWFWHTAFKSSTWAWTWASICIEIRHFHPLQFEPILVCLFFFSIFRNSRPNSSSGVTRRRWAPCLWRESRPFRLWQGQTSSRPIAERETNPIASHSQEWKPFFNVGAIRVHVKTHWNPSTEVGSSLVLRGSNKHRD